MKRLTTILGLALAASVLFAGPAAAAPDEILGAHDCPDLTEKTVYCVTIPFGQGTGSSSCGPTNMVGRYFGQAKAHGSDSSAYARYIQGNDTLHNTPANFNQFSSQNDNAKDLPDGVMTNLINAYAEYPGVAVDYLHFQFKFWSHGGEEPERVRARIVMNCVFVPADMLEQLKG